MTRVATVSVSVSLLALAAVALGCGAAKTAAPGAAEARPLVVTRGSLEDRFALTGELEATTSENMVVPRTPTWMLSLRWLADDGITVKKGDRVAEFDSSTFSGTVEDKRLAVIRTRSELASEMAKATATLGDKQMEVERKQADLDKAEVEASVPADLYPRRVYQEKQLALATKRDALAKAKEELAAQERATRLERTVRTVAATRAERELTDLGARLEELVLRAPRDGLVQIAMNRRENRKFLVGDQTFAGWPVASMPDLKAMQVRARLSDVDDGAAREGMRADCVLDAYPQRVWKGTVRHVSPVARPEGRDASRRFFDVLITIDQAEPQLMRPGMSMRVEVIRRKAQGALIVPRAAVRSYPGKTEVTLTGGKKQTLDIEWCTELACVARGGVLEGTALLAQGEPPRGSS
jgi:HlyD family secretion protein